MANRYYFRQDGMVTITKRIGKKTYSRKVTKAQYDKMKAQEFKIMASFYGIGAVAIIWIITAIY